MMICLDQRSASGCGATNPNSAQYCHQCGMPLRFALLLHDPGAVVGDYRVLRVIGHGMFGAVYEAEALADRQGQVALKETLDPASISSFRHEFALLHRLHHPNLPHYHALFEAGGCGYLVMEFIPGETLEELLYRHGALLEEAEVAHYALQLCIEVC